MIHRRDDGYSDWSFTRDRVSVAVPGSFQPWSDHYSDWGFQTLRFISLCSCTGKKLSHQSSSSTFLPWMPLKVKQAMIEPRELIWSLPFMHSLHIVNEKKKKKKQSCNYYKQIINFIVHYSLLQKNMKWWSNEKNQRDFTETVSLSTRGRG